MGQIKWFDRKFEFGHQNIFPSIIERLWGTPILYRKKLKDVFPSILKNRYNGEWSILENVGHRVFL